MPSGVRGLEGVLSEPAQNNPEHHHVRKSKRAQRCGRNEIGPSPSGPDGADPEPDAEHEDQRPESGPRASRLEGGIAGQEAQKDIPGPGDPLCDGRIRSNHLARVRDPKLEGPADNFVRALTASGNGLSLIASARRCGGETHEFGGIARRICAATYRVRTTTFRGGHRTVQEHRMG